MKVEPRTLKGFRDFLPADLRKRQYVVEILKSVFESYGFEPLETPALEYEDILLGKSGEESDKLMYRFEDNGKRKVALRYDQTVPLARVVAQYQNEITLPFKRYQVQPIWRAENTQKGRYRELVQCDIDTVGTNDPLSDTQVVALVIDAYKKLGFSNFKVLINDRAVFEGLSSSVIIAIDKLKKIGEEGVIKELVGKGISKSEKDAKALLGKVLEEKPTERVLKILKLLENMGVSRENYGFSPTLARGLSYYTSTIFEVECEDYPYGSLGGGGRYDNLIGIFSKETIPAVGYAFGLDRIVEAMEELKLFPDKIAKSKTKALITIFSKDLEEKSIKFYSKLKERNISAEIYLNTTDKLDKQIKYADKKGIEYVVIIGPDEAEKNKVTLKNLRTSGQEVLEMHQAVEKIK